MRREMLMPSLESRANRVQAGSAERFLKEVHTLNDSENGICVTQNQKCPSWATETLSSHEAVHLQLVGTWPTLFWISSVQFSSVAQSCLTLCDPMNRSTPGLPVHHQLPEFTQTRVHWVSDAIQPSHPRSSPSSPVPNPSQHQSLFQWVNTSHEVAKVLELQL